MNKTTKYQFTSIGAELFDGLNTQSLVTVDDINEMADRATAVERDGELVLIDEDGSELVIGKQAVITTETLALTLEDENEDGTISHRHFTVEVTHAGDLTDQQWNRLYEFVKDEWAGSDAVYKFSCI